MLPRPGPLIARTAQGRRKRAGLPRQAAMASRKLALVAFVMLAMGGCTARTTSPDAPNAPAAGPAAPLTVAPAPALPPELAALAGDQATQDPSNPDRGCETDSDCAVKDVGNCCGYFPMCVNKDARTDPAGVRARCEKEGMSSICGFQEISGCQCVAGRCESLKDGAVDR